MANAYDVVLKLSYRNKHANSNYEHASFGTETKQLSGKYQRHIGRISLDVPRELGYVYHDFDNAEGINQMRVIEEAAEHQLRVKLNDLVNERFEQLQAECEQLQAEYKQKAQRYLVKNFKPSKFPDFKKIEETA